MMKSRSRSILPALLALILPALSMAQISIGISVDVPPPELPVYDQPPIPEDGYIWTPGYWAWSGDIQDYYWVPGTWVPAPEPDYLWTTGYWGTEGAVFFWHPGYWGPHVGFYGGVNYGWGYGGNGYEGGYWRGGHLFYNRAVNNISNVQVTNVYNKTVINNVAVNRVSYNGGNGIRAQPTPEQSAAAHEHHIEVTPMQRQHEQAAHNNPSLRVSQNQGHPPVAATPRPGAFTGPGVVPARAPGTFSVMHPNAPQRANAPEREAHPATPQQTPQQDVQRSETQRQGHETQPPIEQRRAPGPPQQEVQSHPVQPHLSAPPAEQRRAPETPPPRPGAPPAEQRRAPELPPPRPSAPSAEQRRAPEAPPPRPSAPPAEQRRAPEAPPPQSHPGAPQGHPSPPQAERAQPHRE
jgi:hypothetical protein